MSLPCFLDTCAIMFDAVDEPLRSILFAGLAFIPSLATELYLLICSLIVYYNLHKYDDAFSIIPWILMRPFLVKYIVYRYITSSSHTSLMSHTQIVAVIHAVLWGDATLIELYTSAMSVLPIFTVVIPILIFSPGPMDNKHGKYSMIPTDDHAYSDHYLTNTEPTYLRSNETPAAMNSPIVHPHNPPNRYRDADLWPGMNKVLDEEMQKIDIQSDNEYQEFIKVIKHGDANG